MVVTKNYIVNLKLNEEPLTEKLENEIKEYITIKRKMIEVYKNKTFSLEERLKEIKESNDNRFYYIEMIKPKCKKKKEIIKIDIKQERIFSLVNSIKLIKEMVENINNDIVVATCIIESLKGKKKITIEETGVYNGQ